MACRILHDRQARQAVFTDSVSGTAFGPVIDESDWLGGADAATVAELFAAWLEGTGRADDPRRLDTGALESALVRFHAAAEKVAGTEGYGQDWAAFTADEEIVAALVDASAEQAVAS